MLLLACTPAPQAVVGALRQRRAAAQRLLCDWEEAEHRLVAVANSLTALHNGQKLVAVGVPMAAAAVWPRRAHAYSTAHAAAVRLPAHQPGAELELSLGQVAAAAARLAAALREELAIAMRGLFLFCLFLPAVLTAPVCLLTDAHRARWLDLVRWTLEQAGPAFIKVRAQAAAAAAVPGPVRRRRGLGSRSLAVQRTCARCTPPAPRPPPSPSCPPAPALPPRPPQWGQWAATRPDLFPADACAALAALQTKAPTHAWQHTEAAVRQSLGWALDELFDDFEREPVASGSIAQVYRARLSARGAALAGERTRGGLLPLRRERLFKPGGTVAVKVRARAGRAGRSACKPGAGGWLSLPQLPAGLQRGRACLDAAHAGCGHPPRTPPRCPSVPRRCGTRAWARSWSATSR